MRGRKKDQPSEAQARLLAQMWGQKRGRKIGGYIPPTEAVLKRRGWIEPTDEHGEHPNGSRWTMYVVSQCGIDALGWYLLDTLDGGAMA